MDFSFSDLNYNSVETLPGFEARATFTVNSSSVFKEDVDIVPTIVDDSLSYIPWGGDNNMPFDILKLIEDDETLSPRAKCLMLKSVSAAVCATTLVLLPQPSRAKSRISFLTTTSPRIISAFAKTSSILALP